MTVSQVLTEMAPRIVNSIQYKFMDDMLSDWIGSDESTEPFMVIKLVLMTLVCDTVRDYIATKVREFGAEPKEGAWLPVMLTVPMMFLHWLMSVTIGLLMTGFGIIVGSVIRSLTVSNTDLTVTLTFVSVVLALTYLVMYGLRAEPLA
jgi:hypothetical protein